ncbi:MAG: hypothetical protein JXA90_09340 [Planctomycetes bacterium]|nr:hypothetical protein [Planctomycetota bacterium]
MAGKAWISRAAMGVLFALASPAARLPSEEVVIVTDINVGTAGSYPSYLLVSGDVLYFRANNVSGGNNTELWRYDGAAAEMVADVNPGPTGSDPAYLTMFRGDLYFSARGCDSCGTRLWRYDGAEVALAPGSESGAGNPQELFVHADRLLFRAFRSGIGIELWEFDGTSQTPIDIFPGSGSSYPQHFIEYEGSLYFNAGVANDGGELWRCDGSAPQLALNITPGYGSSPEWFVVYDGHLYFSADDGTSGRELWRYDGVRGELAADINEGPGSSNPSGMTVYRGEIYFCAEDDPDGPEGYELWRYDGARAELVANINENPPLPFVDPVHHSFPSDFIVFEDILYFAADDGIHGRELWRYDGETASLVADIWPGPSGSNLGELVIYRGQLFFLADDSESGGELGTSSPVFWRLATPAPPAAFRRGDVNADAEIDLSDAVAVLQHLFLGRPQHLACEKSADSDDSGDVAITDAIQILQLLFLGGPPPEEPFPGCGLDESPDALSCDAYSPCEVSR